MFETSQIYDARAYVFQGLKYEERKYRTRHFKRCQSNRFCEQSFEHEGKKWVVSRCNSKNEEAVPVPSPSPPATCKKIPVVPSCDEGKPSGSPSQIPTTEVPEQLDWVRGRMRKYTPNNIRNIMQESMDEHWAIHLSRLQSRADSEKIDHDWSATLGYDVTLVVAEGSTTASSSFPRPEEGQKTPILPFRYHKEEADDSTSGSRKRKSPQQLERRKERRRRAQQVKRMTKSDKQNREPTPRVFMQWGKSEVQRLLYKQELKLKSAHQAELQKQAAIMNQRDQQHKEEIRMLRAYKSRERDILDSFHPADHHVRRASRLLDRVDDCVLWALKGLSKEDDTEDSFFEELFL